MVTIRVAPIRAVRRKLFRIAVVRPGTAAEILFIVQAKRLRQIEELPTFSLLQLWLVRTASLSCGRPPATWWAPQHSVLVETRFSALMFPHNSMPTKKRSAQEARERREREARA